MEKSIMLAPLALLAGSWVGLSIIMFFIGIFTPLGQNPIILAIPLFPLLMASGIGAILNLFPYNSTAQWLVAIPISFVVSFVSLYLLTYFGLILWKILRRV